MEIQGKIPEAQGNLEERITAAFVTAMTNDHSGALFVDFSKAFSLMNHKLLLDKFVKMI